MIRMCTLVSIMLIISNSSFSQKTVKDSTGGKQWKIEFIQAPDTTILEKFEPNTAQIIDIDLSIRKLIEEADDINIEIKPVFEIISGFGKAESADFGITPKVMQLKADDFDSSSYYKTVRLFIYNDLDLKEGDESFSLRIDADSSKVVLNKNSKLKIKIINGSTGDSPQPIGQVKLRDPGKVLLYEYKYADLRGTRDRWPTPLHSLFSNPHNPKRYQLDTVGTVQIDKVHINIEDGMIKNIQVITSGGKIFENKEGPYPLLYYYNERYSDMFLEAVNHKKSDKYPRSLNRKSRKKVNRLRQEIIEAENEELIRSIEKDLYAIQHDSVTAREYQFIHPWDFLEYRTLMGDKHYPDDIDFVLPDSGRNNRVLKLDTNLNNLVSANVFSDILGLANESNGILHTEISTRFIWNPGTLGESWTTLLNYVEPFVSFSKFDSSVDSSKIVSRSEAVSSIDRLTLLRLSNLSVGMEVNLLRKNKVDDFYINAGYKWSRASNVRLRKNIPEADTTNSNMNQNRPANFTISDSLVTANQTSLYTVIGTNFFRSRNFGINLSAAGILHRIWKNSELSDRKFIPVLNPSATLFWHPVNNKRSKLFFRLSHFYSWNRRANDSFFNLQFGTQINFTNLFSPANVN